MKDLAELPIQKFCSYENFDKLGSINGFKNFALFIFKIKIQNFLLYMSPLGVVLDPQGAMEVPERDLTLKLGIFQDAYTRRFIFRIILIVSMIMNKGY